MTAPIPPPYDSRTPELDGVRGLAIALILVWHDAFGLIQAQPGSVAAYALRTLSFAWAGVDLFFVLSGFLIGGILLDNRRSPRYFTTFYVRRACRIFPLYYVVFAIFLLGIGLVQVPVERSGDDWRVWLFGNPEPAWVYASYVQNFTMIDSGFGANWMAVTWSLAVEEQFYLLVPLLIWLSPPAVLPHILSALILVAPIFRTVLFVNSDHSAMASYILLPARWDALFLGVLAAWAWRQPLAMARVRAAIPAIRVVIVLVAVVLLVLLITNQSIGSLGMVTGGHTVIAVGSLAVIALALLSDAGATQRLFRTRGLVWLGTVSYGVYLFHRPVTGLMHGLILGQAPRIDGAVNAAVTVLALGCTLSLAEISSRLFERPIVAIGRRRARY